jgi:hypothetical protein
MFRFNRRSQLNEIRVAALWLYLVAVATLLNSLLLQLFTRFVDLLAGLSITQFLDAIFLGMRVNSQEAQSWWIEVLRPLILDGMVVVIVLTLAVRVGCGSRRAAAMSLVGYLIDTAIFAFTVAESVRSHTETIFIGWQALTFLVHVAGSVIIFRAWRALRKESQALA